MATSSSSSSTTDLPLSFKIAQYFPRPMQRASYLSWAIQFKDILSIHDLSYVINESTSPPPATLNDRPNPHYLRWIKTDKLVLCWIKSTVAAPIQSMLINCTTSRDAWSLLQLCLSPLSKPNLKTTSDRPMEECLLQDKNLSDSMAAAGFDIITSLSTCLLHLITQKKQEVVGKAELITVAPWGHPEEEDSFHHNCYDGIKTLRIGSGWVIDSIEVQYTKRGELIWTPKVGGDGGSVNEIVLGDGEYINEITGYYGRLYGMGTINSLTFFTNKNNKFGPYGLDNGTEDETEEEPTPFQVKGGKIVGFHGSLGPSYLSTLGFYISPLV